MRNPLCQLSILCLSLAVGCAKSKPSESDGEKALKANIDEGDDSRLKLTAFSKTDGAAQEIAGMSLYEMNFEAKAEFQSDAFWNASGNLTGENKSIWTKPFVKLDGLARMGMGMGTGDARTGDTLSIKGTIRFQKRESGWIPEVFQYDVVLDSSHRVSSVSSEVERARAATHTNQAESAAVLATRLSAQSSDAQKSMTRECSALPSRSFRPYAGGETTLNVGDDAGMIRRSGNGYLCAGGKVLLEAKFSDFLEPSAKVRLSRSNARGYRRLSIENNGNYIEFIVHTDSIRVLSFEHFIDNAPFDPALAPTMSEVENRLRTYADVLTLPDVPTADRQLVGTLKSDLRNLATAEEQYAADHGGNYVLVTFLPTATPNSLRGFGDYRPSPNVAVSTKVFNQATPRRWSATAKHRDSRVVCMMTAEGDIHGC